ncbi:MAG: hypothetical protein AAB542_04290 [Patescibacteria group bacterium]
MKTTTGIKVAGITIIVAFIALIVRFLLGGNKDTWLCVNGSWVRHGNPTEPTPSAPCGYYP